MSCMPRFGRLWAIDFCNQFFLALRVNDDGLKSGAAQDRTPFAERVTPARPLSYSKVEAGGHFVWSAASASNTSASMVIANV
jgi:hypothetical protein